MTIRFGGKKGNGVPSTGAPPLVLALGQVGAKQFPRSRRATLPTEPMVAISGRSVG
jgi:hypothetical protein